MPIAILFLLTLAQDPGPETAQDPRSFSALVRAGDYAGLERLAQDVLQSDGKSVQAWFHLGYAWAAQKRFKEAVGAYCEARRLGLSDPKLDYQLGYSAHRAGLHGMAAESLESCLVRQPGNADAIYYLGVSQLELGDFLRAEKTLTRVIEAPASRWKDLARFQRGLARAKAARAGDAQADFRAVAASAQDEDLRERARILLDAPSAPAPAPASAKSWTVAWHEKAGYDSNVLRLPSTSLAAESDEGDVFLLSFLSGAVDPSGDGRLWLRLSVFDLSYADLSESSLDGALFSVEHEAPLAGVWALETSGEADLFLLDRESFFNQAGVKAGLRADASPALRVRAGAVFLRRDFRSEAVDHLDGREAGAYVELELRGLPVAWRKASLRYELADVSAETDEDGYLQQRVLLTLERTIEGPWSARVEARVLLRDFGAEDPDFGDTRADRLWGGRVALLFAATPALGLFLEVELERNASSLDAFEYGREAYALGLTWAF